MSDWNL
jgi:hypothetical protein